jgi:hypothetical protein
MNPIQHARVSARRRGGIPEDYVAIHALIDSTKMLCSDNRHRILHTFWAVQEIIIPIFGHTIKNSDGKEIDVKDICEKDHLLPDFQNRYIPTLSDFVSAMEDIPFPKFEKHLEDFHANFIKNEDISNKLMSPLALTGRISSLLITHNTWFIYDVLPKMGFKKIKILDLFISPDYIFNSMRFELWMDNGADLPPSAKKLTFL